MIAGPAAACQPAVPHWAPIGRPGGAAMMRHAHRASRYRLRSRRTPSGRAPLVRGSERRRALPDPVATMTEALFAAFQLASGDNHPSHYDRPYCRARGHRDLLAHGYQVLIQAAAGAGAFPHGIGDSLIGFIEQSSRFLAPVY